MFCRPWPCLRRFQTDGSGQQHRLNSPAASMFCAVYPSFNRGTHSSCCGQIRRDASHIGGCDPHYIGCKSSQAAGSGWLGGDACETNVFGSRERPLCRDAYRWRAVASGTIAFKMIGNEPRRARYGLYLPHVRYCGAFTRCIQMVQDLNQASVSRRWSPAAVS